MFLTVANEAWVIISKEKNVIIFNLPFKFNDHISETISIVNPIFKFSTLNNDQSFGFISQ